MSDVVKKKSKKKWLILLVVLLCIGGCTGFWVMGLKNAAPMVTSSTVGYNNLESYISISGFIDSGDHTEYIVGGNTEVADVHVENGDQVKAGQLLVSFDHSAAEKNFRSAEISYEKIRLQIIDNAADYYDIMVDYVEAKEDLRVMKDKLNDLLGSRDDIVQNITEEQAARSAYISQENYVKSLKKQIPSDEGLQREQLSLEEATNTLRSATEDYNRLPADIYAEADGVVENVGVRKLSPVAKGTVAVAVRQTNTDTISVRVGKYDLPRIELGQAATVKVGKQVYEGTVTEIGTVATEGNVTVKIKVSNPDRLFIVGLEGDVDILTYKKDNVLSIPVESVKSDRTGSYVYLLTPVDKENTYTHTKTYIEVGNSSDLYTEVLSGLSEGDIIITAPQSTLEYTQLVKLA